MAAPRNISTSQADLVTYAKAMGNGFPIAAIAGKEDVMMTIEPGAMAHGGTYSGNVVGAVAGIATLELLETEPVIETINTARQGAHDRDRRNPDRSRHPPCCYRSSLHVWDGPWYGRGAS